MVTTRCLTPDVINFVRRNEFLLWQSHSTLSLESILIMTDDVDNNFRVRAPGFSRKIVLFRAWEWIYSLHMTFIISDTYSQDHTMSCEISSTLVRWIELFHIKLPAVSSLYTNSNSSGYSGL